MAKDFYSVLEVSPRASTEVIRAAYITLANMFRDSEGVRKRLDEAKSTLLDEKKREEYDKDLKTITGKVVGSYRILKVIGEGGFGRTYLGEHVTLKTPVCIKHASRISPQDEELMIQEAQTIWDLRHWSIPAIRDIMKMPDNSLALIMSYVPGPNLFEVIEKVGSMDPEHVCWITERVLNALKYLHHNGVVHGDVKPHNIIIQADTHQVVLVDYGLSLVRPRKDSANKGFTPIFASPEQERGMPLIPESDLFSLAVTMIHALGGDVISRKVPKDTPEPLCKFIKKLLPHDPLARPNWSKEDLCQTLSDAREESFGRRYSKMKPLVI